MISRGFRGSPISHADCRTQPIAVKQCSLVCLGLFGCCNAGLSPASAGRVPPPLKRSPRELPSEIAAIGPTLTRADPPFYSPFVDMNILIDLYQQRRIGEAVNTAEAAKDARKDCGSPTSGGHVFQKV